MDSNCVQNAECDGGCGSVQNAECDSKIRRFYVSGYTTNSSEAGLFTFDFEESTDKTALVGTANGVYSPSFIAYKGNTLYAASEMSNAGGLAAYSSTAYELDEAPSPEVPICKSPTPSLIGSLLFPHAAGTCFVLPHPEIPVLYGADYNSGSLCICQTSEIDGLKLDCTCPTSQNETPEKPALESLSLIQHQGHGLLRTPDNPNYGRQDSPHVHTLSFVDDANMLAAVDLGLDLIALYKLDDRGAIIDNPAPTVLNQWPGSHSTLEELLSSKKLDHDKMHDCDKKREHDYQGEHGIRLIRQSDNNATTITEAILPVRPAAIVETPLGAGPRIVAYHPTLPIAALICELSCELILFHLSNDRLTWQPYAEINLLTGSLTPTCTSTESLHAGNPYTGSPHAESPHVESLHAETPHDKSSTTEPPLSAHVAFSCDGRFLYTSTRGTNQLAVFSLDGNGSVTDCHTCPSEGDTPRHFALSPDNEFLAVANQTSNNVVLFRRNATNGELTPIANIACEKPSCILWHESKES